MTIGDKSVLAIEHSITTAYERPSLRALGFFVIHAGGQRYGVQLPDATMLACSYDEVKSRIGRRGKHTASFANEPSARKIAGAFRRALYAPDQENESFFGIPQPAFSQVFYSNHLIWAPDGDEAFDDGSYVLHFDINGRVRLIAFNCSGDPRGGLRKLTDTSLEADVFYAVLERWRDAFESEWLARAKVPSDVEAGDPKD